MFLEDEWDHKFLVYQEDPWARELSQLDPTVVVLPFNPTAENLAKAMLEVIGPKLLEGLDVTLIKVTVDETRKCSASAILSPTLAVQPTESSSRLQATTGDFKQVEVGAGDGNTYVRD